VRYTGENGLRFHDMVVRAMAEPPAASQKPAAPAAAPPAASEAGDGTATGKPDAPNVPAVPAKVLGFAVKPGQGGTFQYTFDLKRAEAEALAHLQDFETNTRKGEYSFRQKRHAIDAGKLCVVAFVQDEATKKVLQTVYLKLPTGKGAN
jgi:hypothetical protein